MSSRTSVHVWKYGLQAARPIRRAAVEKSPVGRALLPVLSTSTGKSSRPAGRPDSAARVKARAPSTAVLLLIVAAIGCGETAFVPVEGTVTLNEQPLAGARITFEPVKGTADATATATTDVDGHFELRGVGRGKPGAQIGKNRVMITTISAADYQDERNALPQDRVPAEYQDGSLTFDVPESGTTGADFHLVTRRRR